MAETPMEWAMQMADAIDLVENGLPRINLVQDLARTKQKADRCDEAVELIRDTLAFTPIGTRRDKLSAFLSKIGGQQ